MIAIFQYFFELCRFRANPQDLPSSVVLKYFSIATYMVVGLAVTLLSQPMGQALVSVIIDTMMLVGLAWAGLWVRNFTDRTTQTVTALAGTGTIIGLIGLPVMAWLHNSPEGQATLASLMLLLLVVWNVAVIGHILRHALSLPFWAGIGISVFYIYTSIRVMSALFIAGS